MSPALVAALLAVAAPVPAEDEIKLPHGPPPCHIVAQMNKDGRIEVTELLPVYRQEKRTVTRNVGGKLVTEEVVVTTMVPEARTRTIDMKGVKVYTAAGKEVDPKDLSDKLKKKTIAFLACDGKKVDPFYLKPLKDDTLIIVAPMPEPQPLDKGEKPPPPPTPKEGDKPETTRRPSK
jgi:hypothetical protein